MQGYWGSRDLITSVSRAVIIGEMSPFDQATGRDGICFNLEISNPYRGYPNRGHCVSWICPIDRWDFLGGLY